MKNNYFFLKQFALCAFLLTGLSISCAESSYPATDPEMEIFWLDSAISEIATKVNLTKDPIVVNKLINESKRLLFAAIDIADIENICRLLGILDNFDIGINDIVHPRRGTSLLEYALRTVSGSAKNTREELELQDRIRMIKLIARELAEATNLNPAELLQNSPILHEAVEARDIYMINLVLEYGRPLLSLRFNGFTPRDLAVSGSSESLDIFRIISTAMTSLDRARFPTRDYEPQSARGYRRIRWNINLVAMRKFNRNQPPRPQESNERASEQPGTHQANEYDALIRSAGYDPAVSSEELLAQLRRNSSAIGSHIEEMAERNELPEHYRQPADEARVELREVEEEAPMSVEEPQESSSQSSASNATQTTLPATQRPRPAVAMRINLLNFSQNSYAKI